MPVEISLPFRVGADGRIAMETDSNAILRQHVKALVGTEPGERVMLPEYGVATEHLVFEADDDLVQQELLLGVENAMATWEPGIQVQGINAVPTPNGDGISSVEVIYQRSDDARTGVPARNVNTAVIHPDGSVSEVVRG